ncbi:MAG: LysR family transcriptional regulator [Gammaproteobacteria bacterium]|nr:LysR family transcriptional regulator [Gammaproteobacteria bacterium]MDH5650393.1 LysR family transcriptional regulator [Gammaproteobacteria bacterium]
MNSMDWDLIRSFMMVFRQGSLSAAARELGVSQPTLTRNIQALETQTGLNLFRRSSRGLELTEAGRNLVDAAGRMDEAADSFGRIAAGLSDVLNGDVRISANDVVGVYLLPPAIKALRELHPGLQIEIVIDNRISNLSKREADIALRMFQPTQPDLVARRLPDMALGFFAHTDYLKKYGIPETMEQFVTHNIIGMDEGMEFIEGGRQLGFEFERHHFAIRTDSLLTQINLLRSGAGIVGTHVGLARHWPELEQILDWIPLPPLQFWLVCHRDIQYNRQIQTVMSFLGDWFVDDPYRHAMLPDMR